MSDSIHKEDLVNSLIKLLKETFESPPESWSMYIDQKTGLFESLEQLSAEQASRPLVDDATSVAAQVEHIRFYLDNLLQGMEGRTENVDWDESWKLQEVSNESWQRLKTNLKIEYQKVLDKLESINKWGDDEIENALAMLAHTAYHLGSIRQIIKAMSTEEI